MSIHRRVQLQTDVNIRAYIDNTQQGRVPPYIGYGDREKYRQ